ncbi:MAG: alpha/beta hydrolase [Pseudomonadota bacterium]
MLDNFKTVYFQGDTLIHARVGGEGPPLLLLHGFPQNLWMWSQVAPLLAKHYTVVCADLRGYGDSGKPPASADLMNYSFRAMAQDQVDLMRHLGWDRFDVVGHDRGARTTYRMALDHPERVRSMAVLDIVPTDVMFGRVDAKLARAYWHWYFLQQPAPYPEEIIAANPDHFYEGCLIGWGATGLDGFDSRQLAEYRRTWRQRDAIFGSCADYRAAASVDVELDAADSTRQLQCPALVFWGSQGLMARLFDIRATWAPRLADMACAELPGGHFFIDQFPDRTAAILLDFLQAHR